MNKIDIETGYIYLGDIVITPDKTLDDYREYEKSELASVTDMGEAGGFVTLTQPVVSNGIEAEVTIFIDSTYNVISVKIWPIIHNTKYKYKGTIAKKKWIAGLIENCDIDETLEPFFVEYLWGYISIGYGFDPHYGVTSEPIKIRYDAENNQDLTEYLKKVEENKAHQKWELNEKKRVLTEVYEIIKEKVPQTLDIGALEKWYLVYCGNYTLEYNPDKKEFCIRKYHSNQPVGKVYLWQNVAEDFTPIISSDREEIISQFINIIV